MIDNTSQFSDDTNFDTTKKYTYKEMQKILEFAIEIVNSDKNVLFSNNEVNEIGSELGVSKEVLADAIQEVDLNFEINQLQEQIDFEYKKQSKIAFKFFFISCFICFLIDFCLVNRFNNISFTYVFCMIAAIITAFFLKSPVKLNNNNKFN